MSELNMQNTFFCSAKIRPAVCTMEGNVCCFNCTENHTCQIKNEIYNENRKIKSPTPCTQKNVDPIGICEFGC